MLGNFSGFCCHLLTFSKNSSRNTISVPNGLDTDQDRQNVGPDLGQNCLVRLSADEKVTASKERVKRVVLTIGAKSTVILTHESGVGQTFSSNIKKNMTIFRSK